MNTKTLALAIIMFGGQIISAGTAAWKAAYLSTSHGPEATWNVATFERECRYVRTMLDIMETGKDDDLADRGYLQIFQEGPNTDIPVDHLSDEWDDEGFQGSLDFHLEQLASIKTYVQNLLRHATDPSEADTATIQNNLQVIVLIEEAYQELSALVRSELDE